MRIIQAGTGRCRTVAVVARRLRRAGPAICLGFGAVLWGQPLLGAERSGPLAANFNASAGTTTQWVSFGDSRPAVRVIRGTAALTRGANVEIVTFGTGRAEAVRVLRGIAAAAPPAAALVVRSEARPAAAKLLRLISADPGDLFAPATVGQLDRIAFAVDGVESRHGADLRMWRPEPLGPQGPMQVTAAAASDVGGGDRFDLRENRLLGRAYLARMYRRYGNWTDALAAYNWGPANVDAWIAIGRPPDRMPDETARYVGMVLRDALIAADRL